MGLVLTLQLLLLLLMLSLPTSSSLQMPSSSSILRKQAVQPEKIQAAVLVPGFLTGSNDFDDMCQRLTDAGVPTVAVPMPNWHWIPCVGGRSIRPILERIDWTVQHLIANDGDITKVPTDFDYYTLSDMWEDFLTNPGGVRKVGGSDRVDEYPTNVTPRGTFVLPPKNDNENDDVIPQKKKIALIGHSAGGWISRAYLSDRSYGGKVYGGHRNVHSLVTLGTPHGDAPGPAFEGIKWCNQEEEVPAAAVASSSSSSVRSLAVGGTGFQGGDWGALTQGAYSFCSPTGSDGTSYDGDGMTPIDSALAWPGAEHMTIDNCTHFCWSEVFGGDLVAPELTKDHRAGRPWYGSQEVVHQWADWIVQEGR